MKKNLLALLCCLVLCLTVPGALANEIPMVLVNGIELPDGFYLASGADTVSSSVPASGSYAHHEDGVLTLCDFEGEYIWLSGTLTVKLVGDSTLEVTDDSDDAIYITEADVIIQGSGSLRAYSAGDSALDLLDSVNLEVRSGKLELFAEMDDVVEVDDSCRMIISGTADVSATVTSDESWDGFDFDDNSTLLVKGGSLTISSTDHGIEMDDHEGGPGVIISGGTVNITAGDDAIDSDEGVIINGGTLNLTAEDNGIDADEGDITINGGNVTITSRSRYGISAGFEDEPRDVILNGGKLNITAAHFGIHAGGRIILNGGRGTVTANASSASLAIAACGSLVGPFGSTMTATTENISGDEFTYATVGSDGIPAQTFTYPVSGGSAPSQPRTGDSTPLALLGALLALSLCGMFISRRRSA